jgi:hypothetical protein
MIIQRGPGERVEAGTNHIIARGDDHPRPWGGPVRPTDRGAGFRQRADPPDREPEIYGEKDENQAHIKDHHRTEPFWVERQDTLDFGRPPTLPAQSSTCCPVTLSDHTIKCGPLTSSRFRVHNIDGVDGHLPSRRCTLGCDMTSP